MPLPSQRQQPGQQPGKQQPDGPQPGRMARVLAPAIVRAADGFTRWTTRALGVQRTVGREQLLQTELRELVAVNTELEPEERHIIGKALDRSAATIREVMVPRPDAHFLRVGMTVKEAVTLARETWHTRFPVIDSDADDVVGFIHLRDLIWEAQPERRLGELLRDIKRLPESKPVLVALSEMRRERHTIAVVINEYGGTAGILTLEDLIEELVGEIHDEYDETPPIPLPDRPPAEVDGGLNLADFAEHTGLQLPPGPYETVGGFIMSALGRVPAVGDTAGLETHVLVVSQLDGRRVARARLLERPR